MTRCFRALAIAMLPLLLVACDIEPVSVGVWDIQIATSSGAQESIWTITGDGTIRMIGDNNTVVEGASLVGSRITWSSEFPNPADPSGQISNINFEGTVDGSRLAGTIFTTLGNLSVSGSRQ